MRGIDIEEENKRQAFAKEAAEWFRTNPKGRTFTNGPLAPGKWLAIRWGAGEDCVVVLRIHEYEEIVNYTNIIQTEGSSVGQ